MSCGFSGDFRVLFLVDETAVYLKPMTRIPKREFEQMFGFGFGCEGFTTDKTVVVTKPHDYYKEFLDKYGDE